MKVFIVGGGFAGIEAAKSLSSKIKSGDEIYLIDKNKYTTMLPNLPEVSGDRMSSDTITEDIVKLIPSNVKFVHDEITEVNFDEKKIKAITGNYNYDYLIFAPGSITNFYGFNQHIDKVYVLDSLASAENINIKFKEYIEKTISPTLVVSGAGFTGIELACNLYDLTKRHGKELEVIFVELGKRILPMLSDKSTKHVLKKLNILDFTVYTDNRVVTFDGHNITLKNGTVINDVFFCWCSGVKSALNPIGNFEALPDGRIIVNEFLSIPNYPEVYIAGDEAAIKDKEGRFIRRAVNFAQMTGKHAAGNIAAVISNTDQKPFKVVDLGWVIPLYISSIGVVLGKEIKGRKGIFMHYILSGLNNYNTKNFLKETKAALTYTFQRP